MQQQNVSQTFSNSKQQKQKFDRISNSITFNFFDAVLHCHDWIPGTVNNMRNDIKLFTCPCPKCISLQMMLMCFVLLLFKLPISWCEAFEIGETKVTLIQKHHHRKIARAANQNTLDGNENEGKNN